MRIIKTTNGYLKLLDTTSGLRSAIKKIVSASDLIDADDVILVKKKHQSMVSVLATRMGHRVDYFDSETTKATLFLTEDAPDYLLKIVWKALASKYHPDKPDGDQALFNKYKTAYELLKE